MPKGTVPPFFGNTKDDLHCFQASMKMILKWFEPNKTYSWKTLDTLSGQKKGKWTWTADMMKSLVEMGYDVACIDPFDYKKFIQGKKSYLYEIWNKETADAQVRNSDIQHALKSFAALPKDFPWKMRDATLADIRRFLKNGYLIETGVNGAALNGNEGYYGHSVVLYAADKMHVYLHDSGLPPMPSRKLTLARFKKAWNTKCILAIRKPSFSRQKRARGPKGNAGS